MDKGIRILIVEDSEADAEFITREFGKRDFVHTSKWVKSREEFLGALEEYGPDIILCDYKMPSFGASEVLAILKKSSREIPLIVVSGTIGEDVAIDMMKSGAVDYVMKNMLARVVPAIQRALKETQIKADYKRAEESVRLSAQNWQDTFDALNDAVWLLSPDYRILRSNKAARAMFFREAEEIVGRYCYEVMHGRDKPYPECPISRMRSSGHREVAEFLWSERWLSVTVDPLFDSTGSLAGIVHVITDITGRKQSEETVKKLMNVKSKFISMVSHELRSPLAVVQEALGVVSEGIVGSVTGEQKDVLNMAQRNIDRLSRLINNVLDFQKIESGKMEFDILENDINEVVAEVHESVSVLSKKNGLDLKVELEEALPKIRFDRDKFFQVLMNLASNAIANTQSGSVTLRTQKENDAVHITVRDTGSGISAEDMSKLFQPFKQVGGMGSKKKGGTGLGLAISQEIILAHHGKIWVESEVGSGATFHITLPLSK